MELDELDQPDNHKQQTQQSCGVTKPKFKAPFTKQIKESLAINIQPCSYTTSYKRGSEYLHEDESDTPQAKKKGKKAIWRRTDYIRNAQLDCSKCYYPRTTLNKKNC